MATAARTYLKALDFLSTHYLERTCAIRGYSLRVNCKQGKATSARTRLLVKNGVKSKISRMLENGRETNSAVTVKDLLDLIDENVIKSNWKDNWDKLELFDNKRRSVVPGNTHISSLNGYSEMAVPYSKKDKEQIQEYMEMLDENGFDELLSNVESGASAAAGIFNLQHENMIRAIFQTYTERYGLHTKETKERLITGLFQNNA